MDTQGMLPVRITREASRQTFLTIRFLVDRERVMDAYRAYAYFRWVDDRLDSPGADRRERRQFAQRQQGLVDACYRGQWPNRSLSAEEEMLVELIRGDRSPRTGLQTYIRNMMAVLTFDSGRRGRLISAAELHHYSRRLAVAVTEALYYFIGQNSPPAPLEDRYMAVTAAHVTHMLRDTREDLQAGYFNIPREFLNQHGIGPRDVDSGAYSLWVKHRVRQARMAFHAGRSHLAQIADWRRRLACLAYVSRFESVLGVIERDGWRLRAEYPETGAVSAAVGALWRMNTPLRSRKAGRPEELMHTLIGPGAGMQ